MCYLRTKQHVSLLHITIDSRRRWEHARPFDTEHTTNLQELSLRLEYSKPEDTLFIFRFIYNLVKLELVLKYIPINWRVQWSLFERCYSVPYSVRHMHLDSPLAVLCRNGLEVTTTMISRSFYCYSMSALSVLLRYYMPSSNTLTCDNDRDNLLLQRIVTHDYIVIIQALCARPHVYKWTYARLMSCSIWYDRYEFVVALLDTGYPAEHKHFRSALTKNRSRIVNEFVKRKLIHKRSGKTERAVYDTQKIRNLGFVAP